MQILVAAGVLLTAIFFLFLRVRRAGHIAGDLNSAAQEVRLAARRLGFKRKSNLHPVENIDDPRLAVASIAVAFLELEMLPTAEQNEALRDGLKSLYALDQNEAEELMILGRWFVTECGDAEPAITRLARKLYKLDGSASFKPLMTLLDQSSAAGTGALNARQRSALDDIKRAFRIG